MYIFANKIYNKKKIDIFNEYLRVINISIFHYTLVNRAQEGITHVYHDIFYR